jgi:dipeptidyl aminopeptidase/acylaminoacyl peptidase
MRTPFAIAAVCLVLAGAAHAAAAPHPFDVHDLVAMRRASEPQPSPAGDQVVFLLRSTDLDANRGRTNLWRVGMDGSGLRALTPAKGNDSNPRWSPDGKSLYFLSTRSGSSQVWRLPLGAQSPSTGGEAVQVTRLPLDVESFGLSPDGRRLALSMEVFPDCPRLACTQERLAAKAKRKASGELFDHLFIRHWDTWFDGRRSHLFVVPAEGGASAEPVDLSRGMDGDVPSKPFGGPEEYAFSPDGRTVVFSIRLAGEHDREEPWSTNFDLYQVPADGSAPPQNLTAANPAWDTRPVFSPDGRSLAYLAMSRPGFEADRYRIMLRDLSTGATREVAPQWDRSPDELFFSPDGRTLYATAAQVGQVPLFAIDVATGGVRELVREGSVHGAALAGDRLVFGLDTMRSPVDLYSVAADGSDVKRLTDVNHGRLAAAEMGDFAPFQFTGANGDTVHGWIVKPVGFDAAKRYPVAFLIHGGPQGSFHNEFHYRWNPQVYTGAGYAVVMIDFHGSTGYGQAFTDAISKDWGDKPLQDLQKGLAAALAQSPWMDGDRIAALGASYGGFMIDWIAGNWPDRFRCLVVHDGTLDQRMMYYSTEELWFPEWEQGGPYWTNPEGHEKYNPVRFVERWKTPMLVIHSALDFRIPVTQGIAAFTAAQRRGIPSEFLYFPDENHWILKPANSILWHDTVVGWLDKWLKK